LLECGIAAKHLLGSDSSNCSHCLAAATSIVPLTCDTVMYC